MFLRPLFVIALAMLSGSTWLSGTAAGLEIEPFRTANRSPLVQAYGLPQETTPEVQGKGRWSASLTQDVANIYTVSNTAAEQLLLDGELYRWDLVVRYGLAERFEVGIELPFILQGGGFLDGFIEGWHSTWGFSQGGRTDGPRNRLTYRYTKDSVQRLNVTSSGQGIGDISLLAGYRLYDRQNNLDRDTLSVRAQLKLPSGDSASLRGSGSTDLSLLLTGSTNRLTEWGTVGLFGMLGGMLASDGDILKEQRNNLVGFGSAGIGWSPVHWIAFKTQLNLNTPLYRHSSLDQLSKTALMLTLGGTLRLPGNYLLDIGVAEDVAVTTAPDVTFHLGLSKRF